MINWFISSLSLLCYVQISKYIIYMDSIVFNMNHHLFIYLYFILFYINNNYVKIKLCVYIYKTFDYDLGCTCSA